MELKQAIHCLKKDYDEEECEEYEFYHNCTHETRADIAGLAVNALEKQIQKLPVDVTGLRNGKHCPNCNKKLNKYIDRHCNFCGQAIDWENDACDVDKVEKICNSIRRFRQVKTIWMNYDQPRQLNFKI